MSQLLIDIIGFTAQGLFSARMIVQWVVSERAKKSLSPTLFWQLSLLASFMLITYGILSNDLVIIAGQFIGYFIYIRNLQLKKSWPKLPYVIRALGVLFPAAAIGWMVFGPVNNFEAILHNDEVSAKQLTLGLIGQAIFSTRFLYQWFYSEKKKASVLPVGFWMISMTGAILIFAYAFTRELWPIMVGHSFGLITYSRNLWLYYKRGKTYRELMKNRRG